MERAAIETAGALDLGPREHVVIVGAGGKSTLLITLVRELQQRGARVAAATTTKVRHRQAVDAGRLVLTREEGWMDRMDRELAWGRPVFLGRRLLPTGKVEGIDPDLADAIFHSGKLDFLVVEGDGAAGRPVKAPGPGEPVVPESATRVVAMAGLEALGRAVENGVVFRMERFEEVTGAAPGTILTAAILARVFDRPAGLFRGSPESARRTAFLNKLDLAADPGEARDLARRILKSSGARVSSAVLGSLRQGRYRTRTRT
ncbi:MAG: putative selenium-dependent hydroxylase accessory protein YqeC [Deltaproteobacteria bacterium]|nr:putative selenium-dependent hydroxylase accessory protein YqeC [Deltaproteobacteria bacterium]